MCYFLRTLYACLLLLFLTKTFGQVLVDPTLSKQYTQAFSKLPKWLQAKADKNEKDTSYKVGFVVLTQFITDTLNKEEKKTTNITITDITTSDGKKRKSHSNGVTKEELNGNDLLFCVGQYNYDTLSITIGALFFDKAIRLRVANSKIEAEYNEGHGSDSTFWSDNRPNKTNDLTISAKATRFVLSDTSLSPDKTLYGYCEMETEPYYTRTILFEKGYIKKRLLFKYYFKLRPIKNST